MIKPWMNVFQEYSGNTPPGYGFWQPSRRIVDKYKYPCIIMKQLKLLTTQEGGPQEYRNIYYRT